MTFYRTFVFQAAIFFAISLLITLFLFFTVHKRSIPATQAYKVETGLDRFDLTVERWLDDGFFRNGGMLIIPKDMARNYWPNQVPPDSELTSQTLFVYKNGTASYIVPLFWIQSILRALTGSTNPIASIVYNQIAIALIAVALAMLAFRICRHLELP